MLFLEGMINHQENGDVSQYLIYVETIHRYYATHRVLSNVFAYFSGKYCYLKERQAGLIQYTREVALS